MIQKEFLEMKVVSIVDKREILQKVVLQRYLAKSLEVAQIYRSKIAVVGKHVLTFSSWRQSQSTADILFENHYLLLEVIRLIQLLFRLSFSQRVFPLQSWF